jgi:hypothetical protein
VAYKKAAPHDSEASVIQMGILLRTKETIIFLAFVAIFPVPCPDSSLMESAKKMFQRKLKASEIQGVRCDA